MTPPVLGIDPSLTSTGLALIRPDGSTTTATVRSRGRRGDSWYVRGDRLRALVREAGGTLDEAGPGALVVVESPSYGSVSTSTHDRAGLWWGLFDAARARGQIVVPVSPSQRMMYATGSGRAEKDRVLAAVIRRYPDVEVSGNDVADALVLAAIGRRLVGAAVEESLPAAHLRAMAKVSLPAEAVDA